MEGQSSRRASDPELGSNTNTESSPELVSVEVRRPASLKKGSDHRSANERIQKRQCPASSRVVRRPSVPCVLYWYSLGFPSDRCRSIVRPDASTALGGIHVMH